MSKPSKKVIAIDSRISLITKPLRDWPSMIAPRSIGRALAMACSPRPAIPVFNANLSGGGRPRIVDRRLALAVDLVHVAGAGVEDVRHRLAVRRVDPEAQQQPPVLRRVVERLAGMERGEIVPEHHLARLE